MAQKQPNERPTTTRPLAPPAPPVKRVNMGCAVRPLREGEVMMVYLDFDRFRDRNWTDAEYLLKFGEAVSAATVDANTGHNAEVNSRPQRTKQGK